MSEKESDADDDLAAGEFGSWLSEIQGAIRGVQPAEVPCNTCTACCTASQFIHIGPDETETLAHIPSELLFPAPGLAKGHVLMGYDERGHCPMLRNDVCSIYDVRPRTCRAYDCRVFGSTGVKLVDDDKPLIDIQVRRWRFSYATEQDRERHGAMLRAATFLNEHRSDLGAMVPRNPTQLAALAIELHELFLGATAKTVSVESVRAAILSQQGERRVV